MKFKYMKLSILLIVLALLIGCSENENKINELEILNDRVDDLEIQIDKLSQENSRLTEIIEQSKYHEDLIDLTSYENLIYNKFKESYDVDVLEGVKPISICKMYLYSSLINDYETEYEFYTKNEDYVRWTKEEDMKIPIEHRMKDFSIFQDIYDLKVNLRISDGEHAYITWKSKNGYMDDDNDLFPYGFSLQKDDNVWKVSFLPIQ